MSRERRQYRRPHSFDEESGGAKNTGAQYPPGQFVREAGTVIAICLGLGMLAEMLLR